MRQHATHEASHPGVVRIRIEKTKQLVKPENLPKGTESPARKKLQQRDLARPQARPVLPGDARK
jgi:hypothetical protein